MKEEMIFMYNNDELYHYGVKGMRWGHRKKQYDNPNSVEAKKAAYKNAKKEYNRSFSKAYDKAIAAYSPVKKHRDANNARWLDAANKAEASRNAKAEYKTAKRTVKEQQRQYGTLEDARTYKSNVKKKDMYKAYGNIEDAIRYSKYGNKKAESYAKKALDEIDRQLQQEGKIKNYDLSKVNNYVDKALDAIDNELAKYR